MPHFLTSILSFSEAPCGTLLCGIFGTWYMSFFNFISALASSISNFFNLSPSCLVLIIESEASLPDFFANEELLIQIFTNLIKNGCEAQNNKGKIILKGKTIYEELEIYLNHIKVADVETVMNEYRSIA